MTEGKQLPKQLQAELDELDALEKPDSEQSDTVDENTPEETPPEAPVIETPSDETPAEEPPIEPELAPEPVAEKPDDAVKAELAALKKAHETLQGKYRAEVPRMASEKRAFLALQRQQDERAKELEKQLAEAREAQPPASRYGLTEEEAEGIAEYPWVHSVAEKIARSVTNANTKVAQATQVPDTSSSDAVWDVLLDSVPDAAEINDDPDFSGRNGWLDGIDPIQGRSRRDMLKESEATGDGPAATRLFQAYLSRPRADAPLSTPKPNGPSLASQVSPRSVANPTAPAVKKVYTAAEAETIMDNINRGRYGPAKSEQLMAQIDQAEREGRIR